MLIHELPDKTFKFKRVSFSEWFVFNVTHEYRFGTFLKLPLPKFYVPLRYNSFTDTYRYWHILLVPFVLVAYALWDLWWWIGKKLYRANLLNVGEGEGIYYFWPKYLSFKKIINKFKRQ